MGPDPLLSPFGTFLFAASDTQTAPAPTIGVDTIEVTVTDDDGGSAADALARIVTGTADRTEGSGFWKTEYRQVGNIANDEDALLGYLEIVRFVSTAFDEDVALTTLADAAAVLSPRGGDQRAMARADLLVAWLHFASGGVDYSGSITTAGLDTSYLELLFQIEDVVADPSSTRAELIEASQRAQQTRQAG